MQSSDAVIEGRLSGDGETANQDRHTIVDNKKERPKPLLLVFLFKNYQRYCFVPT